LLRGKDVQELRELQRQGVSIQAISRLTGWDRKTIRKYLQQPNWQPEYGPRNRSSSKLDPFKPYLEERMRAGVWNARVLLRELRQQNYGGGYTILKDWLQPQRSAARTVAVRRFETPPGKQAQVDWGHLGTLDWEGERRLWGFTFTLGYSRRMMAEAALDQKLGTLLRMHEEAFRQMGGVPEEILYDRMKTVWLGTDERGEIVWHPVFLDFARYWGFTPRLCRPYRAQTKGKVESGVKYVRGNFLCGLQGREPSSLQDLNAQLREWISQVANQRVHGTRRIFGAGRHGTSQGSTNAVVDPKQECQMLIKLIEIQHPHLANLAHIFRGKHLSNGGLEVSVRSQYFTGATRELQRAVDWFLYLRRESL
jgi:transposase